MPDGQFFINTGSRILGPLSMGQIESLQARGRLKADYILSKDKKTWQTVGEFFSAAEPAAARLAHSIPAFQSEATEELPRNVHSSKSPTMRCPYCAESISTEAKKCRHCGEFLDPSLRAANQTLQLIGSSREPNVPPKSDLVAGCLGFLLGPVGLWYKGQWAAGFAWIVMAILLCISTGGLAAPICWIGMGLHAMVAKTKE
ncbi:zinc ribbon domain-containing protein [Planctomicrobium sp. SH661]|uniref:zinc ribbon domain-containing protein n=1 Tax=Planctomicrobium sp. SH661 TaxID=3448124 RepID=UPI003F5C45A2